MFYSNIEEFKTANGYDIGDSWYPRVTKIVDIKSKPALYRFYGEMANFEAGEKVKEKSALEGTAIHEATEKILVGEKPEISTDILPAINALKKFLEQKNIKTIPEYIEKRIFDRAHRYAGTIDAIAFIDGKFGVLDIKTSQAIYRDYNLQTSAYLNALLKEYDNISTRWILRIDQTKKCLNCGATLRTKGGREKISAKNSKDCKNHKWTETIGEVELKEFPYWKKDFEAFLGAKKLWEWENEYHLKKIGYLK